MKKVIQIFTVVLFISATLFNCTNYGKEKNFDGAQLFYTSNITESEVNSLGNYLIESGFAGGESKTVQINKEGGTYQFKIVVKKGIEQDNEYAQVFKQFAYEISKDVFNGSQVDIDACDENLKTLRVFPMIWYY